MNKRQGLALLTAVSAVLGFAVFPACFLGPGTREPRTPAPAPASGPWLETGGQRLATEIGEHPAARARAALLALGWTAADSARPGELLGTLHDNLAVVHWSEHGWWVRIEQHSDFSTHEQVPTWDHPWEALRVLHLLVPGAGPAAGWQALPVSALPEQQQGDAAESAYCALLLSKPAPTAPPTTPAPYIYRNGRLLGLQETEPLAIHLIFHLTRTPLDRARLEGRLRAALAGSVPRLLEPALLGVAKIILEPATAAHADPYTVLDPLLRLGADPKVLAGAYRRAFADEAALRKLATLRAAGSDPLRLSAACAALLRTCAVPGAQALPTADVSDGMVAATPWLAAGGRAWLTGLAGSP